MRHVYTCIDCIEKVHGAIDKLSVEAYKQACGEFAWEVEYLASGQQPEIHCPVCNGTNIKKIFMVASTYVGGYGYLDKKGAKNDMNLHLMQTNQDPYKEHRKPGDSDELVQKLRKNKEFNSHPKTMYL